MKDKVKKAFPKCEANSCHNIYNYIEIDIKENHGTKCTVEIGCLDSNFSIKNPNKKDIHFLAIDKCIFDDNSGHKKCDFAVFDDIDFCFVEIKDTATTKFDNRENYTQKAYLQLEETIRRFMNCISFEGYNLEAIVAFKDKPLRPLALPSHQIEIFKFRTRFKASLWIGNEKKFS